jgi:SAM-dependent methyltransferase
MQAYGPVFARVYDLRWGSFARELAPRILALYEDTPNSREDRTMLDLCCGTGQMALHFLEHGYQVTGIDLSESMLQYAREKASEYIDRGSARFLCADASQFRIDEEFGLVVSTYDALNHLEDETKLRSCFESVARVLRPGGTFCFDLNTRDGLRRWNTVRVDDDPEALIVSRGIWDGQGGRATVQLSGFVHLRDGLYERFEEVIHNTFFGMEQVKALLQQVGFGSTYFARGDDLATAIEEPEKESRVFTVARR